MPFAPLINRTAFTFYSGAMSAEQLVHACAERGYPAAGLCDRDGLYAAVRFFKAAKRVGLKPVLGAEITGGTFRISDLGFGKERTVGRRLSGPSNPQSQIPNPKSSLFVFAKTDEGYARLCGLITRRNLEPDRFDRVGECAAATAGGHLALLASDVTLLYALEKVGKKAGVERRATSSRASRGTQRPTATPAPPRTGSNCPSSPRRGPPSWTPRATPSTASCAPPSI